MCSKSPGSVWSVPTSLSGGGAPWTTCQRPSPSLSYTGGPIPYWKLISFTIGLRKLPESRWNLMERWMPCQAGKTSLTLRCLLVLAQVGCIGVGTLFQTNSGKSYLYVVPLHNHHLKHSHRHIWTWSRLIITSPLQAPVLGQRSGMLPGTLTTWSTLTLILTLTTWSTS